MTRFTRGIAPRILILALAAAASPAIAQQLTLDEAWQAAERANPAFRSALAGRAALDGSLAESETPLWHNPSLSYEPSRRTYTLPGEPDQRVREWGMMLSQTFEIAGQQGLRQEAAQKELAAFDSSIAELRRQLRADVEERFVRVLALQRRQALERETVRIMERAAGTIGKRVAAGETSRLEGNLATVEAERVRNQLNAVGESLLTARAELALLLQLAPEKLPEAAGEIDVARAYTLDALLEKAAQRPQLAAQEQREQAARSRLDLERAAAYPDITLGITAGRDGIYDLREKSVGLAVSIPLPLFKRNQAGIGKATSELTQAQLERQAGLRDVRAAVLAQWQRVEQLRARVSRLRGAVLPPLEQNLRLSEAALQAGEVGLAELLLVNRQVLEGRRDVLEAETELRLARIALERAAGWI